MNLEQDAIVRIRSLNKTFTGRAGKVTALDGIDLDIRRGEIFGIIGLSGAGKSTLVRCINFLEKPTAGTVTVDGQELGSLSKKQLLEERRSMGMIFQQFNLLQQRTALQNICFPLEIAGTSKADAEKRAKELLEIVGLSDRAGNYPSQLSGGQQQRVAIARALATNPKILLCDEATSALDPTTTRSILALLKEINRTLGITIIVITHEMAVIEEICQRVAIIDSSRIAEVGAVDDVFRSPPWQSSSSIRTESAAPSRPESATAASYSTAIPRSSRSSPIWCSSARRRSTSCSRTPRTSTERPTAR